MSDNKDNLIPGTIYADSLSKDWANISAFAVDMNSDNQEGSSLPAGSGLVLGYRLSGALDSTYRLEDSDKWNKVKCIKDEFMVLPGDRSSNWRWKSLSDESSRLEMVLLNLDDTLINSVAEEAFNIDSNNIDIRPAIQQKDAYVENIVKSIYNELINTDSYSRIHIDTLKQLLAIYLLRNYNIIEYQLPRNVGKRLSALQLRKVKDYIFDNLKSDISLKDLSSLVFMSEYHFSRIFKNTVDRSPYDYVISCRMEKASSLLQNSTFPIKFIASEVGYKTDSQFSVAFKKNIGVSPSSYRSNISKGFSK